MKILIITGPPYAGKGTQCAVLKEILKFKHISTGDRCRLEKEKGTKVGLAMSKFEEKGELVPDEIMKTFFNQILEENLNEYGIILDGYPRTINQVNHFLELAKSKHLEVDKVINIQVAKSELLKRAQHRASKSNRKDDKDPLIHLKRIEVFEEATKPSIEHMKSLLNVLTFYGIGTRQELTAQILKEL